MVETHLIFNSWPSTGKLVIIICDEVRCDMFSLKCLCPVLCASFIFLIHTKLHISKTFSAVYSIASFHFPLGACFQQASKRPCKTMMHSMNNMFDIAEVRGVLTVSLHLHLGCSMVLFSVEKKLSVNLLLTKNR